MTRAIPLELMYSTFEKSISTGRLLTTPSYVPRTVSRELLEISPVKRRTVTGRPFAARTSSTFAFVSVCTLLTLLGQPDNQSDVTSFSGASLDPLGLIHQRLDQKHAHAAGILFTMHLAVNVRLGRRFGDARPGVHHFHFQRFIAGGKDHAHAEVIVQEVSVFNGVDARLGQGSLKVFDTIVGKADELGHAGSGAHRSLFEAQPRWELNLHRCAPGFNHFAVLLIGSFAVGIYRSKRNSLPVPPKKTIPRAPSNTKQLLNCLTSVCALMPPPTYRPAAAHP